MYAFPIDLTVGYSNPVGTAPPLPRTPIPNIDLIGDIITFPQEHADFMLQLLDEDGMVVYSVDVSMYRITVTLPSWLSGKYECRLYPTDSSIYFYGWIEL